MKKPVFSCSNVFDKRVTLHCHQYFENFLYMFYIQGVRKSLHILHRQVKSRCNHWYNKIDSCKKSYAHYRNTFLN